MKWTLPRALRQFVNTFKEWHYLVAGFSIGAIAGWVAGSLFTLLLVALL